MYLALFKRAHRTRLTCFHTVLWILHSQMVVNYLLFDSHRSMKLNLLHYSIQQPLDRFSMEKKRTKKATRVTHEHGKHVVVASVLLEKLNCEFIFLVSRCWKQSNRIKFSTNHLCSHSRSSSADVYLFQTIKRRNERRENSPLTNYQHVLNVSLEWLIFFSLFLVEIERAVNCVFLSLCLFI